MKDIVENVLEHPIATIVVVAAIGNAVALILHGRICPVVSVNVVKTTTKTET